MNFISNNAIKIFLALLVAIILFHLSIISKVVPYDITWGGRLQNDIEMYVFETTSILINVFLCWILLMKGDLVTYKFPARVINVILWIFFGIFILNTIGNIFAKTFFEKQFAFLTALFSVLIWFILKRNRNSKPN
jgi:membrane protease YdiL (CAAX protease family)